MLLGLVLAVLVAGGLADARRRARIDPSHPEKHHTDLTVYTEAGAAFFDGRDPYAVTNPRGARPLAIAAAAMCLLHYAWPPFMGRLGLLGISTALWCLVAWQLLYRPTRAATE